MKSKDVMLGLNIDARREVIFFIHLFILRNIFKDKEIGVIEGGHESIVWTLVWHPIGHILTTGSNDHTVKFWSR